MLGIRSTTSIPWRSYNSFVLSSGGATLRPAASFSASLAAPTPRPRLALAPRSAMLPRSLLAASTARASLLCRASASVAAPATAVRASTAAPLSRSFHVPSFLSAPREGAHPSKREATNKGMRAKQAAKGEDNDTKATAAAATLDSAAAAASASAAAKSAPSDKSASRSKAVPSSKREEAAAEKASRQAKQRLRENRAVAKRLAQQQENVIEKEVPLMDLTGLTPGQNKVSNTQTVDANGAQADAHAAHSKRTGNTIQHPAPHSAGEARSTDSAWGAEQAAQCRRHSADEAKATIAAAQTNGTQ